jgi:hypothetical protein
MRDGWRGPSSDGGPLQSERGSFGACRRVRGPRDRTHRGYLMGENPWLQLQEAVRPTQCPLCPDSDQILRHSEMTRCANGRHRTLGLMWKRPSTEAACLGALANC